jgi:hypothetical protein
MAQLKAPKRVGPEIHGVKVLVLQIRIEDQTEQTIARQKELARRDAQLAKLQKPPEGRMVDAQVSVAWAPTDASGEVAGPTQTSALVPPDTESVLAQLRGQGVEAALVAAEAAMVASFDKA